MNKALRELMEEWLRSDDPVKRKHAEARLIAKVEIQTDSADPAEVLGSEALRAYLAEHPCKPC
jgi:hypothetical protein